MREEIIRYSTAQEIFDDASVYLKSDGIWISYDANHMEYNEHAEMMVDFDNLVQATIENDLTDDVESLVNLAAEFHRYADLITESIADNAGG